MKNTLVALLAFAAVATALPKFTPHEDIYKNTLEAPGARIVGGQEAERHQFPYQASLLWSSSNSSSGSHICGGILIGEEWVLTAAHCKAYSFGLYTVILGQLRQRENHEDIQKIAAAEFKIHSGYSDGVGPNDIGVIRLAKKAVLGTAVQVAQLASEKDCNAIEDTVLSGWGITSSWGSAPVHLQWAKMPRITNKQCDADLISILGRSKLEDSMLCITSNPGKGQTSCNGDSGGPLVRASNKKLVGIVSWGISPCGINRAPSVFTRVCSHLDWIAENTNSISRNYITRTSISLIFLCFEFLKKFLRHHGTLP